MKKLFNRLAEQVRIINALIMREIMTRYGREGIGFLWLIAEPLAFCVGVIILWTAIKPEYEYGLRVAPFVMSGYMCLVMLRHIVGHGMSALRANIGLLYHRKITPLHIYISRAILELAGATLAFIVVYASLLALGQVAAPKDFLLLLSGWLILAWLAFGLSMIMAALAIRYEAVERMGNIIMYLMIPMSGAFIMAQYVPDSVRKYYLYIPFPHAIEMVRAGIWGEFVKTYYTPLYPIAFGTVLLLIGLLLLNINRDHVETE